MQRLSLRQRLLHKLSPQQIQFIKLLQIPTALLEQRVKQELEENPALEEGLEELVNDEFEKIVQEQKRKDNEKEDSDYDDYDTGNEDILDYLQFDDSPFYKTSGAGYSGDEEEDYQAPVVVSTTFHERMIRQLNMMNLEEKDHLTAEQIIGSLDDDGYLRRDPMAIVDDLAFAQNLIVEEEDVNRMLQVVQGFEPSGVGARDLRECLMLQLDHKNDQSPEIKLAKDILVKQFDAFSKKHYSKLIRSLKVSEEELKDAIDEILKLNPKPGNTTADNSKSLHIIPDFVIINNNGELELKLNARNAPELRISNSYREMLKHYQESSVKDKKLKETIRFVKQKLDGAKWFIDAVRQRQNTLLVTMDAIMNKQKEFFLSGDETKLKPMILKDIAEEVGLDISTISRVANSKYVQTEFGTYLLKSFFSEGIMTDSGVEASSKEVKKVLQDCVDGENKKKPLSDDKLSAILNEKGYNIARRTVAKYREQLGIPVARLRKEL